ncbi:unnamed protein product [Protopolystoma xenopodis]|uniref:Uncharacterized protein n=1 Tax=Protopolystoma xenopodis TaxID=117903 RepID=A0A448WW27_9PLAT|nr:unnamed protein product [Protopolystoma xenopodis]
MLCDLGYLNQFSDLVNFKLYFFPTSTGRAANTVQKSCLSDSTLATSDSVISGSESCRQLVVMKQEPGVGLLDPANTLLFALPPGHSSCFLSTMPLSRLPPPLQPVVATAPLKQTPVPPSATGSSNACLSLGASWDPHDLLLDPAGLKLEPIEGHFPIERSSSNLSSSASLPLEASLNQFSPVSTYLIPSSSSSLPIHHASSTSLSSPVELGVSPSSGFSSHSQFPLPQAQSALHFSMPQTKTVNSISGQLTATNRQLISVKPELEAASDSGLFGLECVGACTNTTGIGPVAANALNTSPAHPFAGPSSFPVKPMPQACGPSSPTSIETPSLTPLPNR